MQTKELPGWRFQALKQEPWDNINSSQVLIDLANGETLIKISPELKRPAASLAKLYIAEATMALAQRHEIDLTSLVKLHTEELEQIASRPGELRFRQRILHAINQHTNILSFQPAFPLIGLLEKSVSKSDNLANLLVVNNVGRQAIQEVLDTQGLHDTTILDEERDNPNVTTSQDMARFLADLYRREFLTRSNQTMLISWMRQRHSVNTGGEVTFRFKEGRVREGDFSYWHEAGFMSVNDGRFAYTVMSEDQPVNNTDGSYPQIYTVQTAVEAMSWMATERVINHPF